MPEAPPDLKAPFDSLTLRAVVCELRTRLIGGQIQDVRQPSPNELRLGIRSHGKNLMLALSCDARFARVHLTSRKMQNAAVPPSFCMAVRKHCEDGFIHDVRQRGFDRILEVEVGPRSGDEGAGSLLVAELMGKHSNLILVSTAGVVLESAKRVSRKINRVREILPGQPYLAPPVQPDRLNPFDAGTPDQIVNALTDLSIGEPDACARWLVEHVEGMSPFLARHIGHSFFDVSPDFVVRVEDVWKSIFGAADRCDFKPIAMVSGGRQVSVYPIPPAQIPVEFQNGVPDLNSSLDEVFTETVARACVSSAASDLRGRIERDRKRLLRQKELADRTLAEFDRAERYKQTGELILANLWQIESGAREITVQDYFAEDLANTILTLNPKLSAQENAEALFKRYRKVRDGQATAQLRSKEAQRLLALLATAGNSLTELEQGADADESQIGRLRDELRENGLLVQRAVDDDDGASSGPDLQGHKIRRYTTPEGYDIYLGETATANDYLTLRLATSNDLWLHVRASTSAHVVIKTLGKPGSVPRSVIEQAALLCARNSSQKHSGLVPVDYTLKKHVRKPRGAAPGSADYHHETTLHITP